MSSELASAYLTLFPKLSDGFGREVSSKASRAVDGAGIGKRAGSAAGAGFSSAMGAGIATAGKAIGALGLAAGIGSFAKSSVDAGMQFDSAMSQVAATMGKTTDEIGELRDFAKQMGSSTAFSASEAAEALNYMALAGYDSKTAMSMLPNVLNLAAAGSMDLASASDMITDTQSALGLSLDETSALVDKMAAASSNTNTSVSQLGSAMLQIGGTAKNLSGGTTELSQALGLLADNGVKGAEGGTALRNILLNLTPKSEDAAKAMEQIGLQAYDANGKMRPLKDIFQDLNKGMEGMTDEQRQNVLANIFNKTDLKSVNALMATNAERWDEVAAAIDNSNGAAKKMADTQLDNLAGDVTIFKSALEGLQISISEAVAPALRGFVQLGTEGIGALQEGVKAAQAAFGEISQGFSSTFDMEGAQEGLARIGKAFTDAFGEGPQLNFKSFGELLGKIANVVVNTVMPMAEGVATFIGTTAREISETLGPIIEHLFEAVTGFLDEHGPTLVSIGESIGSTMKGLAEAVGAVWDVIGPLIEAVVNFLVDVSLDSLGTSLQVIATVLGTIADVIGSVVGGIADFVSNAMPDVEEVKGFFDDLGAKIGEVGEAIAPFVEDAKAAFEDMKGKAEDAFEAIGNVIQTDLETAQNVGETAVHGLQAAMSGDFETAQKDAEGAFEMIRGNIDAKLDAAEDVVASAAGEIGDKLGFPGLEDTVHDVFDNVKGFINDPIGSAQEFVKDRADDIAKALGFDGVEDMAKQQFEDIQKFMEDPIGTAKETIEGIVKDIEGLFSGMNIQFPSLPSLHFDIIGELNLDPMNFSVPTVNLNWYDKGGIFKGGSAQVIGVAERRDEVVAPLEELPRLLGGAGGGVDIHDCTFNVRRESDIRRVAEELDRLVARRQAGAFA